MGKDASASDQGQPRLWLERHCPKRQNQAEARPCRRLVCLDLFEQSRLQRHPRRTGKRGRPEYLYGVGDFSHVTHTPFLTTVPYIGGDDDPAWGPRPEVI